ncbi:MAG: RadC family protein [Chloroflexota bacterium]
MIEQAIAGGTGVTARGVAAGRPAAGPVMGRTPAELLATLCGPGAVGLAAAHRALDALDGIAGLAHATEAELAVLPGIGPARAARVAAAFELGRRAHATWPDRRWRIGSPRDLAERLLPEMGRLEREELRVALLDARNAVIAVPVVYQGNVSSALVRVGELFRDAVRRHAAGLIVVHNHPSGDPAPSPDDLHLTAETVAAGRILDVAVLDHLILGHGTWVSLRDRGVPFDRGRRGP